MSNLRWSSAASRVFLVLVVSAFMVACFVSIISVTGPAEVPLGSMAEFVLVGEVELDNSGPWTSLLAADVPQGWTLHSCVYWGDFGDSVFDGYGTEGEVGSECENDWPPVPTGYDRLWISTLEHTTPGEGGWFIARVRFNVNGSALEHTLGIQIETQILDDAACSNSVNFNVSVSSVLVLIDDFESGDFSYWSDYVN